MSAGSGFAADVVAHLRRRRFVYLVTETAHPLLPPQYAEACGYGKYSARYGDLPTARQMLQLLQRAAGSATPAEAVWESLGRYYDPCRPTIQPGGFATVRELDADRRRHLAAVTGAFERADVVILTLRDADCWTSRADGTVHPDCALIDRVRHVRATPDIETLTTDVRALLDALGAINRGVTVILTISPLGVDGTWRAADDSTVRLRSVVARLHDYSNLVYFPAFELLPAHAAAEDLARVMEVFLSDPRPVIALSPSPRGDRLSGSFTREMQELVDAACDHEPGDEALKCVIWDLDDTVWDGVLLEGDEVRLREGVREVLGVLDGRGIVSSIVSRNDHVAAVRKLEELGIRDYFVYPQIGWDAKSVSVQRVARQMGIALDTVAFVDDQPFERDEVRSALPEVTCFDASDIARLVDVPRMNPRVVTEDARSRRQMYASASKREDAERVFAGPADEFLATLGMEFSIWRLSADDLERAAELTVRTHQLNSTGRVYSAEALDGLRESPAHVLLMAALHDVYGSYGKVGLLVVTRRPDVWTIELLAMSCRILSRGVESVLLGHLLDLAAESGARVRATFIPNGRNARLLDTFRSAGFTSGVNADGPVVLEGPAGHTIRRPAYVTVHTRSDVVPAVSEAMGQA